MSDVLYDIPDNFGGLEEHLSSPAKSKTVILPIPLEKTTSWGRGTEYGPRAVIDASKNMELYDEELGLEPVAVGIYTDMSLMDSGFTLGSIEESLSLIESSVKKHLGKGKFLVALGGEHSVAIGVARAFLKTHRDAFTIVQFDAHADLRDEYEGQKLNHACVMRRLIDGNKVVQVGVRSLSIEESEFARSKNLKIHWADRKVDEKFLNFVLKDIRTQNIYITFDFDVLDPSIMPAVGTPEPGGYSWQEATFLLREIIKRKNLIGIDFCELAPLGGRITHPEFLAARLVYKVIGYKLASR